MEAKQEENSYQEYKKYLEESFGLTGIPTPPRPFTPYMRFFYERNCEERSKGNHNFVEFTKKAAEEWKKLDDKKKEYYQKLYDIRIRQRD